MKIFLIHSFPKIRQSEQISYIAVAHLGRCQRSMMELLTELKLSADCYDDIFKVKSNDKRRIKTPGRHQLTSI